MTPAEMTLAECGELLQYVSGAKFSGTARRMLGEFIRDRGWSGQMDEAIEEAQRRWDARSKIQKMCNSPAFCTTCGKRAIGVRPSGPWACREHWDLEQADPVFDAATGFALTDASPSPDDVADARLT
jgi:hypothetical protein